MSSLYNSTFSVAGMSSSTSSHHHPTNSFSNTSTHSGLGSSGMGMGGTSGMGGMGGMSGSTLGGMSGGMSGMGGMGESRSQYQSGYLLSTSQANTSPHAQSTQRQRVDEVPVVPTKAKMNHALLRGSAEDFGMDSMFESPRRQRKALADDEDAPPMSSVTDIPNEVHTNSFGPSSGSRLFQSRNDLSSSLYTPKSRQNSSSLNSSTNTANPSNSSTPIYVIVFGYPPDKYSVTTEYFSSLVGPGACTTPDPHAEISNCFRIGFYDAGDAMRAVRKNGEVMRGSGGGGAGGGSGGEWMVGVKWADPSQVESLLQSSSSMHMSSMHHVPRNSLSTSPPTNSDPNAMAVDQSSSPVPMVGTPLKLAPSASAFRRTGAPVKVSGASGTPSAPRSGVSGAIAPVAVPSPSPSKGIVGQVSDLIFGW